MRKNLNVAIKGAAVLLGCLFLFGCTEFAGNNSQQLHVVKKEAEGLSTPEQTVSMNLPKSQRDWHTINQYVMNGGSVTMLAPEPQTKENYNEAIRSTVVLYKDAPGINADKLLQLQVQDAIADCRDVATKVLAKTPEYVLYRAETTNCAIMENKQIHYGKAFNGTDGVYGVLYSAKVREVSKKRIHYMAGVIKSSRLIRNPQK